MFTLGQWAIEIYLRGPAMTSMYGAASSLMAILAGYTTLPFSYWDLCLRMCMRISMAHASCTITGEPTLLLATIRRLLLISGWVLAAMTRAR